MTVLDQSRLNTDSEEVDWDSYRTMEMDADAAAAPAAPAWTRIWNRISGANTRAEHAAVAEELKIARLRLHDLTLENRKLEDRLQEQQRVADSWHAQYIEAVARERAARTELSGAMERMIQMQEQLSDFLAGRLFGRGIFSEPAAAEMPSVDVDSRAGAPRENPRHAHRRETHDALRTMLGLAGQPLKQPRPAGGGSAETS